MGAIGCKSTATIRVSDEDDDDGTTVASADFVSSSLSTVEVSVPVVASSTYSLSTNT